MGKTERLASAEVRRLLGVALDDPAHIARLQASELDLLLQLARRVQLLGRVCSNLMLAGKFEQLPQIAKDQLIGALVMSEARARVAGWELDQISRAFRDHQSLRLIILKGCAYLLFNLPNSEGRIFADVDLLVSESQLEKAETILNQHDWITKELSPYDDNYYRRWTHELPPLVHVEREVEIDLHHTIIPPTSRMKPDARKLIELSVDIPGTRFKALESVDMVLHAMVHLMFDSDLADKLRDLVDVRDLLLHFANDDPTFWQRFEARTEDLGLTRPAYYSLRYCAKFLGLRIPDAMQRAVDDWSPTLPARWAMDRLTPHGLYPPHPRYPSRITRICRCLLFIRSHWLRMPPWLLLYHLFHKLYVSILPNKIRPDSK